MSAEFQEWEKEGETSLFLEDYFGPKQLPNLLNRLRAEGAVIHGIDTYQMKTGTLMVQSFEYRGLRYILEMEVGGSVFLCGPSAGVQLLADLLT